MTWQLRPAASSRSAYREPDQPSHAEHAWFDVGVLADLRGNRLVVQFGGMSVLVVKTRRSVFAVENECPHLGRQLSEGHVGGRVIRCAAHGYRWDLRTGRPAPGSQRRPLRTVPARLEGDRIKLAWPLFEPKRADSQANVS